MRVLVTGASGLLGRELVPTGTDRGHDVFGTTRSEMDVTESEEVRSVLSDVRPDVVVHAAAFTDVDGAEEREKEAFRTNRDGAENVARAAVEGRARVVLVSTDYVFDGAARTPYRPDDPPAPRGAYARSKLAGENAVRSTCADEVPSLVVRTGWLYGAGGRNFVDSILRVAGRGDELRVVDDQRGRPTWTRSLARMIYGLIERRVVGTVHAADDGVATWSELAEAALAIRGIECPVVPVSTEEWDAPAPRPRYSVLDLEETVRILGSRPPHWRDSLRAYLEESPCDC